MAIELALEDLKHAESLVAQGRFSSVQEAVPAGLQVLDDGAMPYSHDLQKAVDAGVAACDRNDFATDAEMDALFDRFLQKSA